MIIYGLVDPDSNKIRYVGKTSSTIERRLLEHINDAISIMNKKGKKKINKRYSWIISLLKNNQKPTIKLLEEVENDGNERECYWIATLPNLTNMTKGGDGGDTNSGKKFGPFSTDIINKISAATREGMNNVIVKEKCSRGAYITHSKICIDGKLRKDIVDKIRESTKRKVFIFDENEKYEEFDSIGKFLELSGKTYREFKKIAKHVGKEYHVQKADLS